MVCVSNPSSEEVETIVQGAHCPFTLAESLSSHFSERSFHKNKLESDQGKYLTSTSGLKEYVHIFIHIHIHISIHIYIHSV